MHLNAACDSITSPFPDYPVNTVVFYWLYYRGTTDLSKWIIAATCVDHKAFCEFTTANGSVHGNYVYL